MSLLSLDMRGQLRELFSRQMQDPVTLHFFTQKSSLLIVPSQECHTCRDAGELFSEVTSLSDRPNLKTHDFLAEADEARHLGVERIPALVMHGKNKGAMHYFGVPGGYEFGVVIEYLMDLCRVTTRLAAETRKQITELPAPVHIKVLVTPT